MEMAKVTSKGQITIPKSIRDKLDLQSGDNVIFVEQNEKVFVAKASVEAISQFQDSSEN